MRQMETILVAVGVRTKEIAGAAIALPQSVKITEGSADPSDTSNQQHGNETVETRTADGRDVTQTAEMVDGWDIPDISDLLDSMNVGGCHPGVRSSLSLSEGNGSSHGPAPACNTPCDSEEDTEPDSEHVSWSWDDTHWTTEHTHTVQGGATCEEPVTGPAADRL